jgi:hypothetical protein
LCPNPSLCSEPDPASARLYAPNPDTGFVPAASLTPQHAQKFMPLIFYTMLALVQEFLPHKLEQGTAPS